MQSFTAHFYLFLIGPESDRQITAYKIGIARAHYRLAHFSFNKNTTTNESNNYNKDNNNIIIIIIIIIIL